MFSYLGFRFAVWLIGLLSFKNLYRLSDGLAWLLGDVFRYRRTVILQNLRKSFPAWTPDETQRVLKKTYRNLSDIILEGIKGMTMDQATVATRYEFVDTTAVKDLLSKGTSVIGLVAHYNNWEWGALATPMQIGFPVIGIAKRIHQKKIDEYVRQQRGRFGMQIVEMKNTMRAIVSHRRQPSLIVLIADQSPASARHAQWIPFLDQDTACIAGPDKIAHQTNYPVVLFQVHRQQRGFYKIHMKTLAEHPAELAEGEITKRYFSHLEHMIKKEPSNWLWSHRRWKKKRPTGF